MTRFAMTVVVVIDGDDEESSLQTIKNAIDFVGQGPVDLLESRELSLDAEDQS